MLVYRTNFSHTVYNKELETVALLHLQHQHIRIPPPLQGVFDDNPLLPHALSFDTPRLHHHYYYYDENVYEVGKEYRQDKVGKEYPGHHYYSRHYYLLTLLYIYLI